MEILGYISIMQYVPNARRNEGLNCGVLLLIPSIRYLDVKTERSVGRLTQISKTKAPQHIKTQIRYAKSQIIDRKESLLNDDSYLYVPLKPFNEVRFLPYTSIRLESTQNIDEYHEDLFCELVKNSEGLLTYSIRTLLEHIKENLFYLNKQGQLNEQDVVTFKRAKELFAAADIIRDIIDD